MDIKKESNNQQHIKQEQEVIIFDGLEEICEEYEFDPFDVRKFEDQTIHSSSEEAVQYEYDYEERDESPLLDINEHISRYMIEIGNILNTHEVINVPNALTLNKYMQTYLNDLRGKIQNLIDKCREIYKHNSELLLHQCKPNCYKSTSLYCGAPFFKNSDFYPCWPHPDYISRKDNLNEFFPVNVQLMRSCTWTLRDKVNLLQGVKSQMLKYIGCNKTTTKSFDEIKVYTEQVKTLYDQIKDDEDFFFNFAILSFESLKERHDSYSCAGMWNMYMRPDINRTEFTESENRAIHIAVKDYNCFDWYEIANSIDNRTALQCIIQYWTVVILKRYDQPTSTHKWTAEEDKLLIKLVKENTIGNSIQWVKINSHFPDVKSNRICARYFYSCKPGLIKGAFTIEEDIKLLAAVDEFGEEFSRIPLDLFPGRSVAQLRSHYHNTLKDTTEKDNWSLEEDKKLVGYVEEFGYDWSKISHLFNNRFSRTSCRTRFNTISRYLAKCPANTIENVPRRKRKHQRFINKSNWMSKIRELPNLPPEKPTSKKRKLKVYYVDKLRANEKCFYEYFKYSFDYNYGDDFDFLLNDHTTIQYVSKALDYEEIFSASDKCPKQLPEEVFRNLISVEPFEFKSSRDASNDLPPSWGTILGLRSLLIFKSSLINSSPESKNKIIKEEKKEVLDEHDVECHKMLFKERFRTVFRKTCILSLLHSTEFKPNCLITIHDSK